MANFCRRCLLSEIDKDGYFKNLSEYISCIDSHLKVDDSMYKNRLSLCKQCDHLVSGMCTKCGCYVELRAVMKKNNCADVHKKW